MFRMLIGQAQGVDSECVVAEVIRQCRFRLAGASPGAGLLFSASGFDLALAADMVSQAFPGLPLVGCTTAGTFSTSMGLSPDSVSLALFVSNTVRFAAGIGQDAAENTVRAAREAALMAMGARPGAVPSLALAFPGVMRVNPGEIVTTLSETLGCPVFGGFAGGEDLEDTRQFFGGEVFTGAVPVLVLSGPVKAAFRISNSWQPVGRRVQVDMASGKKVLRIDGKTALGFYRDTIGPHGLPTTEMPLAVFEDNDRFAIRGPLEYDEDEGSITFSDVVPKGSKVRITEVNRDNLLDDVERSLTELTGTLPPDFTPDAALVFSCAARRYILGLRTKEEFGLLRRILPQSLPILGFHAFGEIGPLGPGETARYHNSTLVTVLFGDGTGEGAGFPPPEAPLPEPSCGLDALASKELEIRFLKKQLSRSEALTARLEYLRDLALGLQKQMNTELRDANQTIEEKNRLLREALALAEQVQLRLLPREDPVFPGCDIAGVSLYCDETGGDYYDYLAIPGPEGEGLAVVVGDVSGHGVASALLMTTARAFLRMRVLMGGSPAEHVTDLNRLLTKDTEDTGRFVTLSYLSLDPPQDGAAPGRIRWVRAGHDPVLVYDPGQEDFLELSQGSMPLGIFGDRIYQEYAFEDATKGNILALGTDGIWEARNREGAMFGKKRLRRIIKEHADLSAREIVMAVMKELEVFRRGLPSEDDVTLVVLKLL